MNKIGSTTIADYSQSRMRPGPAGLKTALVASLQKNKALAERLPPSAPPVAPVAINTAGFVSSRQVLASSGATVAGSAASSNPTLVLSGGYARKFEMFADTGMKSIGTVGSVSETVALKKGVTYTFTAAFGLSNAKGSAQMQLRDASDQTLKVLNPGTGKTKGSLTFTPTADGVYALHLVGQPIAKTNPLVTTRLYSGYQVVVSQPLSKLPASSGDKNIDALVRGGTNVWHHELGSTASPSTNIITRNVKSLNNVVKNNGVISYAFMDQAYISSLSDTKDKYGATVMDADTRAAVKTAFDYFSALINVTFTEAASTATADILFGKNLQGGISAGYANPPNESGNRAQHLFLASDQLSNDPTKNGKFAPGTYGWQTLLHEIAHTMGIKHPFNGNAGGGGAPGPYLPSATNHHRFSIMSYTPAPDSKILSVNVSGGSVGIVPTQVNPTGLMTYDIAALQYLYGANRAIQNTDPGLTGIQTLKFDTRYKGMQTIWTPGGATLDASDTNARNIIDLRGGAYSTINHQGTGAMQVTNQLKAAGITSTAAIASILSTKFFSPLIKTAYTGMNNVGLAYGSKISEAKGGSADDAFYVSSYNAMLAGGAGSDMVYLTGSYKDWTASDNTVLGVKGGVLGGAVTLTNKITKAVITLESIEKYGFYSEKTLITKA